MSSSSFKKRIADKGVLPRFLTVGAALAFTLWTFVAVFGIGAIVGVVVYDAGFSQLGTDVDENSAVMQLLLSVVVYTVGMMFLLIEPYALRKMAVEQIRELIGLARRPVIKDIGFGFVAWGAYMALATFVNVILSTYAQGIDLEQAQDIGFQSLMGQLDLFYAFLVIVVLAPIVEEIVFRGYLYGSLRPRMPWWVAGLITSVLFGLVHGQINVGVDTFILSMVLCYLRERTGAIWSGIFVHSLKNALAFYILFVAPDWAQQLLMGM